MKSVIAVLVFSVCLCLLLSGHNATVASGISTGTERGSQELSVEKEKDAIKQVVQHYLDVTDKKDYESIKRAFHPDAKLMSVSSSTGELTQMSQEDWWKRTSRNPGKVERTSKISLLDITGIAAVVRVDFERSSDYISLLKIGGEWKIVNKLLSTKL